METEKINKYQNGKIYVIRSPSTDKIYIGSTIEKYLSGRFSGHNSKYKRFLNGKGNNVLSFEIIKLGNAYIELLELFPCNNKLELHKREGELIRAHKINCVNRSIPTRTHKEYCDESKDKFKEYYEKNKEHITKIHKEYRECNKDKMKKYQEQNKEHIRESYKEYYQNNKEKNKEKTKEYKKKYNQNNKDKINDYQRQYRLKKKLETTLIDQIPN
jgi:hypothetical protein